MAQPKSEFDSPWKQILDIFFEGFVAYCWPKHYKEIDWHKGYKCLDKELTKIARKAPTGNRVIDKLIEVHLNTGEDAYVLIHLEVQGNPDAKFEERMFTYRYRLRDLHSKPIASIAILIDNDKDWRPGIYREELWCSSIEMRFPIIKLLDYQSRVSELEASSNRFAPVILAQLVALKKDVPQTKLANKLNLIKSLFKRGWPKDDVIAILRFIDWVIALPPSFEVIYQEKLSDLEEESKVDYVTSFEKAGIKKGIEQGFQQGESTVVSFLLERKFKNLPEEYRKRITNADPKTLLTWAERILESQSIEEVFDA